jgi:RNA recognition motif-containing protein
MVGQVVKTSFSCDAMMQEIAESSVESILTGIDTTETYGGVPDTPPSDHRGSSTDWFTPPNTDPSFGVNASWSFNDNSSANFKAQRQLSASGANYCMMSAASGGSTSDTDDCEVSRAISQASTPTPMGITTVMLRNIPNKYTRSGLLTALVERGFDPAGGDCNNLYLPMDAGSGCNLGYAFLNFTTHERALAFMQQFDGVRLPSAGSRKVCSVVWANKQGLFQHSNPPDMSSKDVCYEDTEAVNPQIPGTTCKIFVGGLPSSTTEADLIEYFARFGPIREASIVTNRQTGQSRGFGFCEFMSPESVDQVAQSKRPHSINCRVVSVRPYNTPESCPPQHQPPPVVTSFLMGHGGSIIEYPMYPGTDQSAAFYCPHPFMSY